MAANSHFSVLILLIAALLLLCLDSTSVDAQIGVVYGTKIRNPPPAKEVIELCIKHRITRMRLYEPNRQIFEALKGSKISVILGVPNEAISAIAENTSSAENWLQTNVINYPGVQFRYIQVGNNINPLDKSIAKYVVPAMQNMVDAVKHFNRSLQVSTAIDPDIRMNQQYSKKAKDYVNQVLDFLVYQQRYHRSPLTLFTNFNLYSSYISNPNNVTLEYSVLFKSDEYILTHNYMMYKNWFDLYVDELYDMMFWRAHKHIVPTGRGLTDNFKIIVETGWPTAGGIGANVTNAEIYNTKLIRHINQRNRDKRSLPVETYIVGLFDEDLKNQKKYNKHFGLFDAKMNLKYTINF